MSLSHLMGELMANHHSNPEFIRNGGCEGIKQKTGLSVGGQTPVLHRTRLEVRDGYQIWKRENTGQGTESERGKKKKEMPCSIVTEKLNKANLVWVEDSGCWNTPHRSLAFWQQPPGHSGFAATSQGLHRRTPTDTQSAWKTKKSNNVGKKWQKFKYGQGGHTCTPEDVVAVTDLKSQMTKATRYVLIFTLASNWSSSRPSFTLTVFTWKTQTIYCRRFSQTSQHVW